jgi:hypothetical protein
MCYETSVKYICIFPVTSQKLAQYPIITTFYVILVLPFY